MFTLRTRADAEVKPLQRVSDVTEDTRSPGSDPAQRGLTPLFLEEWPSARGGEIGIVGWLPWPSVRLAPTCSPVTLGETDLVAGCPCADLSGRVGGAGRTVRWLDQKPVRRFGGVTHPSLAAARLVTTGTAFPPRWRCSQCSQKRSALSLVWTRTRIITQWWSSTP